MPPASALRSEKTGGCATIHEPTILASWQSGCWRKAVEIGHSRPPVPMEAKARIEAALAEAVAAATAVPCPSRLAEAIAYAVFPGGGRVRPGLCLAVAGACGDPDPGLAD